MFGWTKLEVALAIFCVWLWVGGVQVRKERDRWKTLYRRYVYGEGRGD